MSQHQTQCSIVVEGDTIEEIAAFDYLSDVMTLGEEAHFTVVNKNQKYRSKLQIGAAVEFRMSHPAVNGGVPTVKHRGRITTRSASISPSEGSVINVTSADLGWHLMTSHTPLWVTLNGKRFADLLDPTKPAQVSDDGTKYYFLDPSWGIKGIRFEFDLRRRLKLGIQKIQQQQGAALTVVPLVQTGPGMTLGDVLNEYATRENMLVNVSPDGYLCLFKPNDTQEPLYTLRLRENDHENNVLAAELTETAQTRFTEVINVGDMLGPQFAVTVGNPNPGKTRGLARPATPPLPFVHLHTVQNSETYTGELCRKQAEWVCRRGMFDSWYSSYTVAEHHQGGVWWESDCVAGIDDDELGNRGNFYVQSVRCQGSKTDGDTTQVVVRLPGLLSASFNRPRPKAEVQISKGEVTFG